MRVHEGSPAIFAPPNILIEIRLQILNISNNGLKKRGSFLLDIAGSGIDQLGVDDLHGTNMDVIHVCNPFAGIVDLQLFGDILIFCHGTD